ncbi:excisionase family DNA-binding protein [Nocardia cyriacigeorgica]|uniref:excisionase family DNA-binding protein n=1 Tax=Nocardia cyriacigeorgica TaxID=135487 RepID=UPI003CC7F162
MSTRERDALQRVHTEPTISVDDWAELTGIGRSTCYAAVKAGETPAIKVGKRLRIPSAWVRRQLQLEESA